MDAIDLEQQVFCYFIMGTVFPLLWGCFFLLFSMEEPIYMLSECQFIVSWGYLTAILLFVIGTFYLILIIWSLCAFEQSLEELYNINIQNENPKLAKVICFEENWLRVLILLIIVTLFSAFGIIQQNQGQEVLRLCGNIYKLAELFFYMICGMFVLVSMICLIICSTDLKPDNSLDNTRAQRQGNRQVRYAHHYSSIEDMF